MNQTKKNKLQNFDCLQILTKNDSFIIGLDISGIPISAFLYAPKNAQGIELKICGSSSKYVHITTRTRM